MRKPSAKEILALTDDALAHWCAMALVEHCPEVFWLCIDHDIRSVAARSGKPKTGACPVEYTWANRAYVGIDTKAQRYALDWARRALLQGYTVSRAHARTKQPDGLQYSLSRVRAIAKYDATPRSETDDDIPF